MNNNTAKITAIRSDFPLLRQSMNGHPLVYLDSAAHTLMPQWVIEAIAHFGATRSVNIQRGAYAIAEETTALYEHVRAQVAQFIGAQNSSEIVFTTGTTESINLVAHAWAFAHIKAGDEILVTEIEHHANLLPWQFVAQKTGARLRWIPVSPDGTLDLLQLPHLISRKTKLVAVSALSNVLGFKTNLKPIIDAARSVHAITLVDAAQVMAHESVNVSEMDVDFLAFSGHKMFGPTSVGVLYAHKRMHEQLRPFRFGGGMASAVTMDSASFRSMPLLLEAGTPPIEQVIGLGAAISYLQKISYTCYALYQSALCARLIEGLSMLPGVTILGHQDARERYLVSFVVREIHAHDVAAFLDSRGIAVRAGNHCAQPLHRALGLQASVRASFSLYNTPEEVDFLLSALKTLIFQISQEIT